MTLPLFLNADCPPLVGDCGIGYDYFRSIPEGDWEGNTGAYGRFNLGVPYSYCGVGAQVGGGYGVYDWTGRGSSTSNRQNRSQLQLFLTGAITKTTPCDSGFNGGLAYDWMWNRGYGVFATDCNFSQLRGQFGYLRCRTNEYGLWATLDLGRSHVASQGLPLTFRALSQVDAYWKHFFANCSETMIWVGVPYKKSLSFSSGRAGKFIIGGSFHAPLTERLSLDGHANYMVPHSVEGALKQRYYAANICLELNWAFGEPNSPYRPYMPIANNSNFIADTNLTY